MADIESLTRDLRSFRTRKQAMSALAEMGDEAVDPLIAALESHHEGVPWAAARCLGMIGSERSVEALVACLDRPAVREAACWALGRITGKDFGSDPKAWRAWLAGGRGAEPEAGPDLDDETLLREAVRGLNVEVTSKGAVAVIQARLDGGRQQTVRVAMKAVDFEKSPIVLVYSECGPADPRFFEYALKANMTMPYGALAIRSVEGQDRLVMFNSMLRRGLTPLALRKSIVSIAEKADKVQERLEGGGTQ